MGLGGRVRAACAVAAVVAASAALAGLPARATRGARTTADEPQYLLSALSLAEDGDLDIADELAEQRWRPFHEAALPEQTRPLPRRGDPGGEAAAAPPAGAEAAAAPPPGAEAAAAPPPGAVRRVSPHDPLLPVLLAWPVAAGGVVGAKVAMAGVAAALAALVTWTAVVRLQVRPATAAAVAAVGAASVPLASYGSQIYPELPAALAATAAVAALLGPLRARGAAALVAAVVALPWLATKYVPVAAVLALVGMGSLWRRGDRRAAVALASVLAVAGGLWLAAHQVIYGGWTPYAAGDHFAGRGELSAAGFQPDLWGRTRRLVGLLVDDRFGLAAWQPAWLLAVPAAAALVAHRQRAAAALLLPLAAGWATATWAALTMQGWWVPGRQVVVVLPLALLVIARWLDAAAQPLRTGALVLGAWGIWSYGWLAADAARGRITWVVDFFAVGDPLYQSWRRLLPDYLTVTPGTWVRHAAWTAALLAAAAAAHQAARRPSPPPSPDASDGMPSLRSRAASASTRSV